MRAILNKSENNDEDCATHMIPAAATKTINTSPVRIPKIIQTLLFLVLALTVTAGLVGAEVTNKKQNLQEMYRFPTSHERIRFKLQSRVG